MTKSTKFIVVALAILLVMSIFYANRETNRADDSEANLPFEVAKVIEVRLAKTATLRVATISGNIIARADDPGFAGLLSSSQTRTLPFTADYFVDLEKIGVNDYRWLEAEKTMIIEVPDVTISKPNIDEASQIAKPPTGIFVSREAASRLQQQLSSRAGSAARAEARKPENLENARESARKAIRNIVSIPLEAAGLGRAKVVIQFPWERRGSTAERWDESTPLSEIYRQLGKTE